MSSTRHARASEVLLAALECADAVERAARIEAACAGDALLAAEVRSLLAEHERTGGFLERPAFRVEPEGLAPGEDRAPPARIGPYAILGVLGAGGMGVVYLAEEEHPPRRVALKVIRPDCAGAAALRRFETESRVLARLQHPGIAQIYAAGTEATPEGLRPWFAMELVQGEGLLSHAARLAGPRERLMLFARICDALQHAHQKGVIHRDLKPDNVLVAADGQPKVLDFGVARLTDPDQGQSAARTAAQILIGTPRSMSPEQVLGGGAALDARSDVYALGLLGYELLTGTLPYSLEGRSLAESARIVRETPPRPLGAHDRALRGDLQTIFGKALEKERERRYGSAAELAADVRRWLASEPIAARPPSASYRLERFARRNRVLVAGLAATFAALVLGLSGTLWQALRATSGRTRALAEQAKALAVADFLRETLSAAHPDRDGRDVKVLEVLTRAVAALDGAFAGEPEVEAELRKTLGESFLGLGLFAEAVPQLERAFQLRTELFGADDVEALAAQSDLGLSLKVLGRLAEAEQHLRAAHERLGRVHGPEHPVTLTARGNLAELCQSRGDLDEAQALAQSMLDALARPTQDEHQARLASIARRTLAQVALQRGELERAEELLRATLDDQAFVQSLRYTDVLALQNALIQTLIEQGELDEAEELLAAELDGAVARLGEDHASTLVLYGDLAALHGARGELDEAEEVLRFVLERRTELLGPADPSTLTTLNALASLLDERGRHAEAEPLFRRILAGLAASLTPGDWRIHSAELNLGHCLASLERRSEAEPLLHASLAGLEQRLGPDATRTRLAVQALAELYEGWGRDGDALPYRSRLASQGSGR